MEEKNVEHACEPWIQAGKYIRDANLEILVRARSEADARRIVAAVNAVRGIPTDALEQWTVQVVSEPAAEPVFEFEFAEAPEAAPASEVEPVVFERRMTQRRQAERR